MWYNYLYHKETLTYNKHKRGKKIKKSKMGIKERVSLLKAINTIMLNETDEDVIARLVKIMRWYNETLYR